MRNHHQMFLLSAIAAVMCAGCESDSKGSEGSDLQTRVSYSFSSSSFSGGTGLTVGMDTPVTLCEFLNPNFDAVVIAEIVNDPVRSSLSPACDDLGPYNGEYAIYDASLHHAIHGDILPTTFKFVLLSNWGYDRVPAAGDIVLVQLRQSGGEWFLGPLLFADNPVAPTDPAYRAASIPAAVADLKAEAARLMADYANECSHELWRKGPESDQEFYDRTHTWLEPKCHPDTDDPALETGPVDDVSP